MANGRLTYVGHATVLIEVGGARFLTDPLLHGGIAHMRRRVPLPQLEQLRDLDAVLISHAHADHLDTRSLRMLGHAGAVIAPRGCAGILRRAGMRDVVELMPGDRHTVAGVEVEAVRADHDGRRHPFGQDIPAVGFLLEPARIYFAGDTDLFDEMEDLAGVDVALLPIGGWGPKIGAGHLDPQRAAEAAAVLQPRIVVPIHWGTYLRVDLHRRRPHLLTDPAPALESRLAELAPKTEMRALEPGQSLTV